MSGRRTKVNRRNASALRRAEGLQLDAGADAELKALQAPAWRVIESDIQQARAIVARTGLVEEYGHLLVADRGPGRVHCTFEGLLVALTINVILLGRAPFLSEASITLYECMPEKWRDIFSSNYPVRTVKSRRAAAKAVERLWAKFREQVDGEALPVGPRRTEEEMERVRRQVSPEEKAEKDAALTRAMNAIVGATVGIFLEKMPKPQRWLYGLDATVIPSHALPPFAGNAKHEALYSADPQAGWYIRKRNERYRGPNVAAGGGPRRRRFSHDRHKELKIWGYEVHIVGLAPDPYSPFRDVPELALGISIDRPGFSPTNNGIKALGATVDMGLPAGILGFDAAYITEPLLKFAADLGFGVLFDPRATQADDVQSYLGGLVAGGGMVCPGVERTLLRINADYHQQKINSETMYARAEALEAFRPWTKEQRPNGRKVMACPATAPAGRTPTCCCPLRPESYKHANLPQVPNPPGVKGSLNEQVKPGLLCTQKSITVHLADLVRVWQQYPHRSPQWRAVYAAVRNAIERNHSQSKAGYGEALAIQDRRGLRGKANAGLLSALMLAAHNVRIIRSWLRNAERDPEGVIIGLPTKNRRGDRTPWHALPPGPAPPPAQPEPSPPEPEAA